MFRRRVAYFGTLVPTLGPGGFPTTRADVSASQRSWIEDWVGTLGDVGNAVASVTPWYLAPVAQCDSAKSRSSPAILAALAVFSYWRGKSLSIRIADRARAAWSIGHNTQHGALRPSVLDRLALKLLGSPRAKATWALTSGKLFPAFAGSCCARACPCDIGRPNALLAEVLAGEICASQTPYEDLRGVIGPVAGFRVQSR